MSLYNPHKIANMDIYISLLSIAACIFTKQFIFKAMASKKSTDLIASPKTEQDFPIVAFGGRLNFNSIN